MTTTIGLVVFVAALIGSGGRSFVAPLIVGGAAYTYPAYFIAGIIALILGYVLYIYWRKTS